MNYLKKFCTLLGIGIFIASTNSAFATLIAEAVEGNPAAHAATTNSARQIVQDFQSELIEVMKVGAGLDFKERYKRLEPAILKSHDLVKISRIVLGKEWKNLSNKQQATMLEAFIRLSVSAYAFNFKEFSGESFVYLSEYKTAKGGIIVHTILELPEDKGVKFDYMLKEKGGNWRIINIIANGVSDLALKRSEYTNIMKRKGFDVLIAKINEKINNYEKQ